MGIFDKVFGTYSDKEVKKIMPLVNKINGYEEEFKKLSDADLIAKTDYFKVKIFDVELEELSTTKTVNFGSTYGTLPTPTTPGYQFAGWNGKNLFEVGTIDDYYIY